MTTIPVLRRAVEERHDCIAMLREIVHVEEPIEGGSTWEGAVMVFSLTGNPTSTIAYAWCDPSPSPDRLQLHVALQAGPVDSPATAVRRLMSQVHGAGERVS